MKIIIIGFDKLEIEGIKIVLRDLCEVVVPSKDSTELKVKDMLNALSEEENDWFDNKIIIIHDGEKYIKEVMNRVKSLQLGRIIFATTTPISLEWKLKDLLNELKEEDEYFRKSKRK